MGGDVHYVWPTEPREGGTLMPYRMHNGVERRYYIVTLEVDEFADSADDAARQVKSDADEVFLESRVIEVS